MHLYAPALETECTVSWTEPVAYDARDPDVSTRRDPEWLKPGETLKASEWPYSVRYSATDASGNFNSCSFLITVSVIRCPHPTQQQHIGRLVEQGIMLVKFYPDTNDYNVLLGTTFVATCAYGYSLSDESAQNMRTCTASGAWDGADVTCIKVQCEPLRPPFRGRVSCTDEYNFLSECTYSCDEGFDIPSGMNRVRVCTAAAEWTGNQPQCKDIMRPKIIDCPGPLIIEYLDMNEQDVSVVWDEPTVVDNADFSITAKLSMGQPPGSSFTVGSHSVLYTATDRAGNEATPCELTVSVRAITCPVIHKKPYQLVSCPGGNSYGSRCEFSCEDGAQLIGTNFSYCIKEGDPPVGYWDWEQLEGSQPKCEGHPCRPLRVPQNGALACDTWLYGKHCTMLCNDQYDIPPDRDEPVRNSLWVCGSSGNWDYPDPPHCSEDKRPNSITLPSELQYFIGDCGTADTQEQIRLNFVQIFLESAFGFICVNLNCAVDDVNVICGETTGRKIADAPVNSSEPFVLTIKFDFALPISGDISVYEGEQVLYSLAEETVRLASSGNWTLKNLTGSDDFLNMKSFKPGLSEIQCPVGMEPRYNTLSCVGCSVGTFYNSTAKQCQTCPIGSYQDESSQHSCKRCPYGQSTVSEGASNSTDCKHECKPGTFSSNGVQPCTPCNSGEYQPTRGQLSCISCQPATTTLLEGAVNASACENFDFQFPSQNQNYSSYVRYGDMEFKNSSGITVSFWLWFDKNCDRNASIFYYHCVDTASDGVGNASALYPCLYMKSPHSPLFGLRRDNDTVEIQTGTTLRHETWHHVGVVYRTTNNTYTITVDGSVVTEGSFTQRQQHLQETINQRGSLWLGYHIADGEQNGMEPFAGFISNVNIWSHAKNESDLLDMARTCVNKDAGDVLSWSQLGTAEQRKVSLQIPSLCDDTDECASAPCGDNRCVDQLRDYSCICKAGFTGQNCEINIDDCEDNVCQNNATCLDGVGNYTCLCSEGFVGDFCGVESVDGNWTPWSQWSSCSASCGGGNHSRTRECINPRPMHGGSNCTGPSFEIGACNTEKCPVCKNLTDPVNGIATCNYTDDEIHCTISCKPGFEFYDQPVLHYYCGQSTSYLWNHESPRNPLGRYPPCSEATQPKALDMKHVMTYSNLSCNTKEIARLAKAEVNKTIQINVEKIECIKHKSCYVRSTTVENCLGMIGESHAVTVTLELSSISVADMGTNNTSESHSAEKGLTKSIMNMESAAKQLKNMTLNDAFTVFIDNEPYPVDNNATKTSGAPDCAIGEVAVMFYCVPCPVGTSFDNGKCVKCDIGTYQNETGQVNCIACPTGLTTEGFGAFDKEDCRVTETAAVTTDQPITHAYAHAPGNVSCVW
ncbi:PREDICTED: sushi, von Willebrand factor type A, EGF and pentraxin domain-containing protein 1-like [Branchiostoma belcheri]|uniref:Sushi, von Willebrand factor type A, EGF and pentraxin domain-containing protein 1-like n=1 Tax=Branchiostoma belcheri TaxID=7741 RepID=A0A6P4YHY8_BRABE|nr:PREDICTED: sushi, von Willebrand factor type A, EGF and pentraxin domain-containing protein 1-like [Branchiostoma belcheri]